MKKKISVLLITLITLSAFIIVVPQKAEAAVPTVKMGGVALTADYTWHAYNSKKPTISGWTAGKYRLSKDGKTLELNGVKYSGSKRGIYSSAALTVKTTGTNTFTCNKARGIGIGTDDENLKSLTLTGASGSVLNLKCTEARSICVYSCTVSTVTVNATGPAYCEGSYTQSSGKLAVTGNFDAFVNSTISGGTFSVTGDAYTGNNYKQTAGTGSVGKEMTVFANTTIGGGTLTVKGDFLGFADFTGTGGTVNITKQLYDDGNMTVNGANVTVGSGGIYISGNLNVSKGTLTGNSTFNEAGIAGIHVEKNATVSGTGKIVSTAGNSISFYTWGTLTVTGGSVETSNSENTNDGSSSCSSLFASNLVIKGGSVTANANGNVGDAITANNNITVSGGSLLGKCTNRENWGSAITAWGDITVSGGSLTGTGASGSGIHAIKNCNVSGSANVKATSENAQGIYCNENFIISGGTSTSTSGNSNGFCAESLIVSGGTISGKGKSTGIHTDNVIINGGYVYGESQEENGVYAFGSFEMTDGKLTGKTASEKGIGGIYAYSEAGNISIADDIWVSTPSGAYTNLDGNDSYFNVYESNDLNAKEATLQKVNGISVKSGPTNQMFREDYFDPSGIALDVTFADGSKSVLPYNGDTKDVFDFNIPTDEPLSAGAKNLSINCRTKTAATSFTVKDFKAPRISGTASVDKVHLSWEPVEGANYYVVHAKEDMVNNTTMEYDYTPTYYTEYTVNNLSPGTTMGYSVTAYRRSTSGKLIKTDKSNVLRLTTVLQTPKVRVAETDYHSVRITWDAIEGAEEYMIYIGGESGFLTSNRSTSDTEYVHSDLITGATYRYAVKATKPSQGANGSISETVSATPTFSGSTNLSVRNSNNGYDLSWETVDGATGYEVYRGNDAAGARSLITTVDGTEYADKSADIYTKYNYAVRAYRYVEATDKNYYGQWSNVAVTVPVIKKDFTESEIDKAPVDKSIKKISKIHTTAIPSKKSMKIDFEKISGAYDYRIEYRKRGEKKWKKRWTGKKNSFTITGMKNGQFLEFRFAAYKYKDGKLRRGAYSTTSYRWYVKTTAKVKAGKKSVTVKMKKYKGATGYKVFYADVKTPNKIKSKQSSKNNIKITGLKKGHTYIIRYRPIKKVGGHVYQGMALEKKIKVKK